MMSSDEDDVHQCGRCKQVFHSIENYFLHKKASSCKKIGHQKHTDVSLIEAFLAPHVAISEGRVDAANLSEASSCKKIVHQKHTDVSLIEAFLAPHVAIGEGRVDAANLSEASSCKKIVHQKHTDVSLVEAIVEAANRSEASLAVCATDVTGADDTMTATDVVDIGGQTGQDDRIFSDFVPHAEAFLALSVGEGRVETADPSEASPAVCTSDVTGDDNKKAATEVVDVGRQTRQDDGMIRQSDVPNDETARKPRKRNSGAARDDRAVGGREEPERRSLRCGVCERSFRHPHHLRRHRDSLHAVAPAQLPTATVAANVVALRSRWGRRLAGLAQDSARETGISGTETSPAPGPERVGFPPSEDGRREDPVLSTDSASVRSTKTEYECFVCCAVLRSVRRFWLHLELHRVWVPAHDGPIPANLFNPGVPASQRTNPPPVSEDEDDDDDDGEGGEEENDAVADEGDGYSGGGDLLSTIDHVALSQLIREQVPLGGAELNRAEAIVGVSRVAAVCCLAGGFIAESRRLSGVCATSVCDDGRWGESDDDATDPVGPLSCAYCDRTAETVSEIYQHKVVDHVVGARFRCVDTQCKRVFRDARAFAAHARVHGQRAFICGVCNAHFRDMHAAFAHKSSAHRRPADKMVDDILRETRDVIGVAREGGLRHRTNHSDASSPSTSYLCEKCASVFGKREHLVRHIASKHSSERPFKCVEPQCGRAFKRADKLRRHEQLVHAPGSKGLGGVRTCPAGCRQQFARADQLKRHLEAEHNIGIRWPARCGDCQQGFASAKSLHAHIRTAHGLPLQQPTLTTLTTAAASLAGAIAAIPASLSYRTPATSRSSGVARHWSGLFSMTDTTAVANHSCAGLDRIVACSGDITANRSTTVVTGCSAVASSKIGSFAVDNPVATTGALAEILTSSTATSLHLQTDSSASSTVVALPLRNGGTTATAQPTVVAAEELTDRTNLSQQIKTSQMQDVGLSIDFSKEVSSTMCSLMHTVEPKSQVGFRSDLSTTWSRDVVFPTTHSTFTQRVETTMFSTPNLGSPMTEITFDEISSQSTRIDGKEVLFQQQ